MKVLKPVTTAIKSLAMAARPNAELSAAAMVFLMPGKAVMMETIKRPMRAPIVVWKRGVGMVLCGAIGIPTNKALKRVMTAIKSLVTAAHQVVAKSVVAMESSTKAKLATTEIRWRRTGVYPVAVALAVVTAFCMWVSKNAMMATS